MHSVACRVFLNALLTACHLVVQKRLVRVIVVLSLLVTVNLAVWYYISWTRSTSFCGVLSNTCTPTTTGRAGAWRRNVNESIMKVNVGGNFSDRVARFNVELNSIRQ